jgi:hypothetical protein
MEFVDQSLFERGGTGERNLGEEPRIEAERDDDDARKDRDAQPPPYPLAGPNDLFITVKTRPPMISANACDVAAPAA